MNQSPHQIVLIEDNPADTLLLRHALEELNQHFDLEVLPDGDAALRFVRQHCGDTPDPCLIILDLHLPMHHGAEVLREIRSSKKLSSVAVAVVTTSLSPKERQEVMALGVSLCRTKPMDWEENLQMARDLMDICTGSRNFAAHS